MPLATKVRDDVVQKAKYSDVPRFEILARNDRRVLVFEDSPRRRTIFYHPYLSDKNTVYQIGIPWAYYMLVRTRGDHALVRACLFFSEVRLEDEGHKALGLAPLPNIFNRKAYEPQGTICLGRERHDNLSPRALIERFWGYRFTGEIAREQDTAPMSIEAYGWGTLRRWAALTRKGIELKGFQPITSSGKMLSVSELVDIVSKD